MAPFAQTFLPLTDPLGMGLSDWILIGLAALLAGGALLWRPWIEPFAAKAAQKRAWCMLFLAVLPVALRLVLLPRHPAPVPDVYDEFSHLLVADTLHHFRLANPPHRLPQFFETLFVLQQPTYSSIYPPGQGLMLAAGWMLFGSPWAGVMIATAALCALCYWMLRGWTTPGWALAGGLLAVLEFGPLCQWTNSYWGGAFAAAGGCLIFGALPRLRRQARLRDALLLGAGLSVQLVTRPYESVFVLLCVLLYLLPMRRQAVRPITIAGLVMLPAAGLILLQNKQVTGSYFTLPYVLSQYQYGVPAALTFQKDPVPHRQLTHEQEMDYRMQLAFRGERPETLRTCITRLLYRIRYYRFFFLPPLYLVLPFFLVAVIRDKRWLWAIVFPAILALGVNFFPIFQYHYMAAVTCMFVLMSVIGLEQLSRFSGLGARMIAVLCLAQFGLEYSLHVASNDPWSLALRNPERRVYVAKQLAQAPGKQLVFVRYWPQHIFQDEWVYNAADIDSSRVVWARDLGDAQNSELRRYYPGRTVWLLEPDARPPRLEPYPAPPGL